MTDQAPLVESREEYGTENVSTLPVRNSLEFLTQQDSREFWLMTVDGQPPERQRAILLNAVVLGYLDQQDADIFLDACGGV